MSTTPDFKPPFAWTCPFCNTATTINITDISTGVHELQIQTKHGRRKLFAHFIVCPNPSCKEYSLILELFDLRYVSGNYIQSDFVNKFVVIPSFISKIFPNYIPSSILNDYYEACKIRELSSKASATLSRRCLQGMIRDFWGISKNRLVDEIADLQEKVDTLTWEAIDSVRKVGNIGAHMERDVNIIIDVDPSEASLLIGLIEILLDDWYIARHDKQSRLTQIIELGLKKNNPK